MLVNENARSVNHRYNETDEAETYSHRSVPSSEVDPIVVLKSVQCLEYQSCETADWSNTEAFKVLKAIEAGAIAHLRGYKEAPWGWTRAASTQEMR